MIDHILCLFYLIGHKGTVILLRECAHFFLIQVFTLQTTEQEAVQIKTEIEEWREFNPTTQLQLNEAYRLNDVEDEKCFADYKRKVALRKSEYRKKLSGEKLHKSKEKAKLRQKAFRQRQKAKGLALKPKDAGLAPKQTTKHKMSELRAYWREKKRKSRQKLKMTSEDEREKRGEHYETP